MRRFDFRLDPVLNLRRAAEDTAKRAHADARRAAALQAAALADLQAAERRAKDDLRDAQRARELVVGDLMAHQRFALSLARSIAAARRKLADLEAAATAAREDLVAAARARKALENLRERRHQEWTAESLREEQKTLDEIGQSVRSALR
ncbi:MAG: flagellar export protein FliJ [Planctomycetes bacterium]|nr:flagellar export protein FliJ [Planctomycetota bacterium]